MDLPHESGALSQDERPSYTKHQNRNPTVIGLREVAELRK